MTVAELAPPGGWLLQAVPNLPPPPAEQRGFMFRAMSVVARRFGRSQVPDIFAVFQLNGRLFWPWLFFASRLMPGGRLRSKERELVILRTGWNCRSRYEWGQHVDIGLQVGLPDEDIVRVTQGPQAFGERREALLIAACDELCRDRVVAAATWQALRQHYNEKLLIEIVILIGHYIMVAGFLNSSGIALEAPIEARLHAFHQRIAASASKA